MVQNINIDFGTAIPYLVESVLEIFGRDTTSQEVRSRLEKHIGDAMVEASYVQCIGMDHPIPITDIYQPTQIETMSGQRMSKRGQLIDIWSLIANEKNAIVFGGPGEGKTILTHWIYTQLISKKLYIPMLFPLRWSTGLTYLIDFIDQLSSRQLKRLISKRRIVLIVDGYDEIIQEDRKKVSAALRRFISLELGNFYLTCRTFYDIYDLPGPRYQIGKFNPRDSENYIKAFSKAYGVKVNAKHLIYELNQHGFGSFLSHPLMLALVCILKSGPMPSLPRTTIGLIRRAIDTLTFRWDEVKGIYRDSRIPIDGDERIRCLMHIAYNFHGHIMRETEIITIVNNNLKLLQHRDINIKIFLNEIAQWYGVFIPVGEAS